EPRLGDPGSGGRLAGTRAQYGDPAAGPGLPGRHADDPEFAGELQAAGDQVLSGDQVLADDQVPGGGLAGEPSEAAQAFATARVPRFTEGIPGSTAGDASGEAATRRTPARRTPAPPPKPGRHRPTRAGKPPRWHKSRCRVA